VERHIFKDYLNLNARGLKYNSVNQYALCPANLKYFERKKPQVLKVKFWVLARSYPAKGRTHQFVL